MHTHLKNTGIIGKYKEIKIFCNGCCFWIYILPLSTKYRSVVHSNISK